MLKSWLAQELLLPPSFRPQKESRGGERGRVRAVGAEARTEPEKRPPHRDTERERQAQGCDPGRPPGISQASSLGTQQGRAGLRPQAPHTGGRCPYLLGTHLSAEKSRPERVQGGRGTRPPWGREVRQE